MKRISVLCLSLSVWSCSGSKPPSSSTDAAQNSQETGQVVSSATESDKAKTSTISKTDAPQELKVVAKKESAISEDDRKALEECLSQWSSHPFKSEEIEQPLVYKVGDTSGSLDLVFTDDELSDSVQLKLVIFDMSKSIPSEAGLFDENAWYCVHFRQKVSDRFLINQQCGSQLRMVSAVKQSFNDFVLEQVCE